MKAIIYLIMSLVGFVILLLAAFWTFVIGPFLGFQSSAANGEVFVIGLGITVVVIVLALIGAFGFRFRRLWKEGLR